MHSVDPAHIAIQARSLRASPLQQVLSKAAPSFPEGGLIAGASSRSSVRTVHRFCTPLSLELPSAPLRAAAAYRARARRSQSMLPATDTSPEQADTVSPPPRERSTFP